MRGPARPVGIAAIQEFFFKDRSKNCKKRLLDNPVANCWNRKGSLLFSCFLIETEYRHRSITSVRKSFMKVPDPCISLDIKFFPGHAVDTRSSLICLHFDPGRPKACFIHNAIKEDHFLYNPEI